MYEIFPARTPLNGTEEYERLLNYLPELKPGLGITAEAQGLNQLYALGVTIIISIGGGLVTGVIIFSF